MAKINPFKPNSPVPPGMFAGRLAEIEALEMGFIKLSTAIVQIF